MKTSAVFALAAASAVKMAAGHSTVFNIWVNDVDQGLGNSASGYIRSPPNNDPVKDVTSSNIRCNVNGDTAAAKTIEVSGGDKITFEWHHNDNSASDDIIASSHLGPVLTYIAPGDTTGDGWVKLAESGYDTSTKTWAVTTLIANKGKHSVTLPDLAAGSYLLRPEIIALHEAENSGGAQFYMECVQIKVTSSGSVSLPSGVSFPGAYAADDAGILFDVYNSFDSYPIPGPAVWDGASSGDSSSSSSKAVSSAAAATSAQAAATSVAVSSAAAVVTSAVAQTSAVVQTSAVAQSSAIAVVSSAPVVHQTTFVTSVRQITKTAVAQASSAAAPAASSGSSSGSVQKYGQCGGANYSGATTCADNWVCKDWNPYYSQCVESA